MSFRGGRGAGRGGRGGRGSASAARVNTQNLLKRSAVEAGLSSGTATASGKSDHSAYFATSMEDIIRPRLFPDILWHSSGRRGHDKDGDGDEAVVAEPIKTEDSQNDTSAAETNRNVPDTTTSSSAGAATVISSRSSQQSPPPPKLAHQKRSASTIYILNKQRQINQLWQQSAQYVRPQSHEMMDTIIRYGNRQRRRQPGHSQPYHRNLPVDAAVLLSLTASPPPPPPSPSPAAATTTSTTKLGAEDDSMSSTNSSGSSSKNQHPSQDDLPFSILATDTRYFPAELLVAATQPKQPRKAKGTTTSKKPKQTRTPKVRHGGGTKVTKKEEEDEDHEVDDNELDEKDDDDVLDDPLTAIQPAVEESAPKSKDVGEDGEEEEDNEEDEPDEEEVEDYVMDYYASEAESDGGDDAEATF